MGHAYKRQRLIGTHISVPAEIKHIYTTNIRDNGYSRQVLYDLRWNLESSLISFVKLENDDMGTQETRFHAFMMHAS